MLVRAMVLMAMRGLGATWLNQALRETLSVGQDQDEGEQTPHFASA
jgi:hypothetical protein